MIDLELGLASNMLGQITGEVRLRLKAVVENPTEENWDDTHGIILNKRSMRCGTLWQAVLAVDPTFPQVGPTTDEKGRRLSGWRRVPDRALLIRAIKFATH